MIRLLSLCLSGLLCSVSLAADWPQFLGPQRTGVSAETGLLKQWPATGLKEVWRVPGGVGMSAVAVADGKALTMVQDAQNQSVLALSAKTGETLWRTPVASGYRNGQGNGPRATPTIVKDRVYTYTGEGVLTALNLADGKVLWAVDAVKKFSAKPADYGMASSPLAVGQAVIVTVGGAGSAVVAFSAADGSVLWKQGAERTGYASPALLNVAGKQQVVAFTGSAALGLDPSSGEALWKFPFKTDYDCNTANPLSIDGKIFLSAGESHGSVLLAASVKDGAWSVAPTWSSLGRESVMRNEWQTSILQGEYLYGLDNVGSAGPVTHLACIEAATGKRVWSQTRFGKSNLISADGKLFFTTMKGEVVIVQATPKGYQELGRQKVLGQTRQAPSLANGLLYVRDDREIVCLDVR